MVDSHWGDLKGWREDASDQRKKEPWKCYDDEDCVEKQDAFTVKLLLVLSGRQSPEGFKE